MHITLVKKIKADGLPCRKCVEVQRRLEESNLVHRIDRVVSADERDPESEGMRLSRHYDIDRAPFFIVEDGSGEIRIYTAYLRFLKEVLKGSASAEEEAAELMEQGPGLDYI